VPRAPKAAKSAKSSKPVKATKPARATKPVKATKAKSSKAPLAEYRRKRDPSRTPEPIPPVGKLATKKRVTTKKTATKKTAAAKTQPASPSRRGTRKAGGLPTFVIQEHHATSLHWDFRLEHDGVYASWALPKGLPRTPKENHLAVHVEDHPLEYGSFHGTIPKGEYGGGQVSIWDEGTYEPEKWRDREVMVVLHGKRAKGRYVLFPTNGKNWMIHRMDPAPEGFEPLPAQLSPMLATAGPLPAGNAAGRTAGRQHEWAYEFKWDGIRVLLWIDGGRPRAESRNGNDVTISFPELREMAEAVGSDQVVLDGEMVALDDEGRPRFSRLQRRMHISNAREAAAAAAKYPASMIVFDVLHLNGRSLLDETYDERRKILEGLGLAGPSWGVTPAFTADPGDQVMRTAVEIGMEGVVAKRRSSTYRPGVRSRDWIKTKHERTQEVVIGGWSDGVGERKGTFGALLLGIPVQTSAAERTSARNKSAPGSPSRAAGSASGPVQLTYVGKVGTGFTESQRRELLARFTPRAKSPFAGELPTAVTRGAHWVRPDLVGEVRFGEWTPDGVLRHPVWRGERTDKSVKEVVREP
jgi:bifunctional non-homologous end joining protein LigD